MLQPLIKQITSSYRRRISADEASGNFIFVAKHWLDFFPEVGKIFKLKFKNKERYAIIEAINCNCVGPERPHRHFCIKLRGIKLNKGDGIVITKHKDGYILRIVK